MTVSTEEARCSFFDWRVRSNNQLASDFLSALIEGGEVIVEIEGGNPPEIIDSMIIRPIQVLQELGWGVAYRCIVIGEPNQEGCALIAHSSYPDHQSLLLLTGKL